MSQEINPGFNPHIRWAIFPGNKEFALTTNQYGIIFCFKFSQG